MRMEKTLVLGLLGLKFDSTELHMLGQHREVLKRVLLAIVYREDEQGK